MTEKLTCGRLSTCELTLSCTHTERDPWQRGVKASRGRWAGEKSRVRASIVGPMSDRGPRDAETRGEQKSALDVPG